MNKKTRQFIIGVIMFIICGFGIGFNMFLMCNGEWRGGTLDWIHIIISVIGVIQGIVLINKTI